MTKSFLIACAALIAFPVFGQETFKCKINGNFVYQDRPCPGAGRYSDGLPAAPAKATIEQPRASISASSPAQIEAQKSKLEKDKEYIDERVKARVFDREKGESLARVADCDNDAAYLMQQADAVLRAPGNVYNNNLAGAMAAQAENQQRQTEVLSLQNRASARRNQCDAMRQEHARRFDRQK